MGPYNDSISIDIEAISYGLTTDHHSYPLKLKRLFDVFEQKIWTVKSESEFLWPVNRVSLVLGNKCLFWHLND